MSDPALVAPLGSPLTPRERAVLESWWRHRASRSPERRVADELGISRFTVHAHLANVRSRLGVTKTFEAALTVGLNRAA